MLCFPFLLPPGPDIDTTVVVLCGDSLSQRILSRGEEFDGIIVNSLLHFQLISLFFFFLILHLVQCCDILMLCGAYHERERETRARGCAGKTFPPERVSQQNTKAE
mmetsp:Transcript_8711/g.13469  ORF Transcript_8711/g.13469 Transcript_8711/m.13469 type:complete len:106 (+) Transcript_8711:539-856(+)